MLLFFRDRECLQPLPPPQKVPTKQETRVPSNGAEDNHDSIVVQTENKKALNSQMVKLNQIEPTSKSTEPTSDQAQKDPVDIHKKHQPNLFMMKSVKPQYLKEAMENPDWKPRLSFGYMIASALKVLLIKKYDIIKRNITWALKYLAFYRTLPRTWQPFKAFTVTS